MDWYVHHDALVNPILYFHLPCLTNDHSGSPFDKYCEADGPIVNIRFLFENRVGALLSPQCSLTVSRSSRQSPNT